MNMEECNCDCHNTYLDNQAFGKIVHVMACCNTCPICKKHIKQLFYNEHKTKCEETHHKFGDIFDRINMDKLIKDIKNGQQSKS